MSDDWSAAEAAAYEAGYNAGVVVGGSQARRATAAAPAPVGDGCEVCGAALKDEYRAAPTADGLRDDREALAQILFEAHTEPGHEGEDYPWDAPSFGGDEDPEYALREAEEVRDGYRRMADAVLPVVEAAMTTATEVLRDRLDEAQDNEHEAWLAAEKARAASNPNSALIQADLGDILRALGLFDGARPLSPHEVVQQVIVPNVERLRGEVAAAKFEIRRLQDDNAALGRMMAQQDEQLDALRLQVFNLRCEHADQSGDLDDPHKWTCNACGRVQWSYAHPTALAAARTEGFNAAIDTVVASAWLSYRAKEVIAELRLPTQGETK